MILNNVYYISIHPYYKNNKLKLLNILNYILFQIKKINI